MEIFDHPDLRKYVRSCPAGSNILSEGDRADALYILIEGSLDVIKGGKKIYEIDQPGSFFGELSFLLGTVRIASVISATEDAKYLCLPNSEVDRIWRQFPEFARNLARNLATRLYETTNVAQGFRQFCDQMPDAVIMTNANHAVLCWNQAAERLYGRSWSQMNGNNIDEIYDNQAAFKQFISELDSKDSIREKTLKINHPEKEWFFVSTSTTVLKDTRDNIQGYLFLSRDATSVCKLEKKQKMFRKWLLPMLTVLAVVIGWLCWRQYPISPVTDPGPTNSSHQNQITSRLNRDIKSLELALLPAINSGSPDRARKIIANYFELFHPELYGINGVLLIDEDKKIFCGYLPFLVDETRFAGQLYQGIEFSDNGANKNDTLNIYLVSRPDSAGGEGVEVVTPLKTRPLLLAFHLNMELIEKKHGLDTINALAKALSTTPRTNSQ